MVTKLTLRMEQRLVTAAKIYARKHQTSLSRMISAYFLSLKSHKKDSYAISSLVEEISGVLPSSSGASKVAKNYQRYLHRKYQ